MRMIDALWGFALVAGAVAADRQLDVVGRLGALLAEPWPGGATAQSATGAKPQASARKVRVVTPKAGASRFGLTLVGRTAPIEQGRLSARAAGIVVERNGEIGDRVRAGDVLVVVDAPEVRQQLDRARAAVEQVKARLELAKVTLERAKTLVPNGFLTEQSRDERLANVKIAEADLDAAKAEVRRLEEVQGFQTIRAPFAGVIIERQVERGDRVVGDFGPAGTYLYNLARLDQLRIEIDVPQSDALKVTVGTPAKITFGELPNRAFEAKVVRTSRLVDQTSSTMRAELVMDNPDLILPAGLIGQVVLDVERENACVLVPGNALVIQRGDQLVAVADGDDKIAFRRVMIGRDLGAEVEVCSGITTADRVILSPIALLKPGDKVEVMQPVS